MYIINENLSDEISVSNYKQSNGPLIHGKESFGPFSSVNIFIGANNSGKSRFLRGLLKTRMFNVWEKMYCAQNITEINRLIEEFDRIQNGRSNLVYTIPIASQIALHSNAFFNIHHRKLAESNDFRHDQISMDKNRFVDLVNSLNFDLNSRDSHKDFITTLDLIITEYEFYESIIGNSSQLQRASSSGTTIQIEQIDFGNSHAFQPIISQIIRQYTSIRKFAQAQINPPSYHYVPVLRSAVTLFDTEGNDPAPQIVSKNILVGTVASHYNLQIGAHITIHTGKNLYELIQETRNDVLEIRRGFEEFEKFISNNFYRGAQIDIVARKNKKSKEKNIIVNIDGEENNIHDLGDGVQAILIIMFCIYNAEKNAWVFIEEPEINLHPGFQRILLETILHDPYIKSKNLRVFFTTHSNHLVDISIEFDKNVSIFTCEKIITAEDTAFEIKNVKQGNSEILSKLGVQNGSVFMSNCSIWVEGVSDRNYIKAFLKAYFEENLEEDQIIKYKEDVNFCFFEYAGSNLSHYLFLNPKEFDLETKEDFKKIKAQYLNNKIFLIADMDSGKDKKHLNLISQENENFKYLVLPVREIENLLSPVQLKGVLPMLHQSLRNMNFDTAKINQSDYADEYLGKFIKKFVSKAPYGVQLGSSWGNGTLNNHYKMSLSKIASNNLKWNEMSKAAQNLTIKLYDFIHESNGGLKNE